MYKEYRPLATVQYKQHIYYNEMQTWRERRVEKYYKLGGKRGKDFSLA